MQNKDYILNIGPGGISLIAVNDVDASLTLFDTFEIQINVEKSQDNFGAFYKHLMQRLSEELVYKVMEGEIYNGDLLRLLPEAEGSKFFIKVCVYRQTNSQNLDIVLEKYSKNIPESIKLKKEEIESLRNKLNLALESKNFQLCDYLIQKINYIKDEFMI